MTLEDVYFISQILAAVAIVASLIFVVLQLRQSDRTQRAMMHQLRAQRGMDLAMKATDPLMSAVGRIISLDANVTANDIAQASAFVRALILNLDDTVWQQKAALLGTDAIETSAGTMRQMFALPGLRAIWLMFRSTYGKETIDIVDKLVIDNTPLAAPVDIVAAWRMVAKQLQPATKAS
jgi:hypothetical protein